MNVLILSCVFPPEAVTSAITSQHLAETLSARGHSVTVLTSFPNKPGGKLFPGYKRRISSTEFHDGYRVVRLPNVTSPSGRLGSRLLENISFGLSSSLRAVITQADVVYSNSWPLFATAMTAGVCWLKQWPLVLSIQDLYPETLVQMGKLKEGGWVARVLRALDSLVARSAIEVIVISNAFAELYSRNRGVKPAHVHVIPNWMDEREVTPMPLNLEIRRELQIPEQAFVAMYAGNLGENAAIESLVSAATMLRHREDIYVVFAGDGSRRAACEALSREAGLTNVRFLCPLRRERVSAVQAAADILLLTTRSVGALTSVPSKLIAYSLSARPIVAAVHPDSDSARFLSEAGCGVRVDPENPTALASAVLALSNQRHALSAMGWQGRAYAEVNTTKTVCASRLADTVLAAAAARTVPIRPGQDTNIQRNGSQP